MIKVLSIICLFFLVACNNSPDDAQIQQWKNEIIQSEKDFADMAKQEGIPKAFLEYAAKDAVLMRNNKLVKGWEDIKARYKGNLEKNENESLEWAPEFVDVAASGDLAYTYGPYTYTRIDSVGNKTENSGVFHTVWKRQKDGNWKYVWD